MLTKVKLRQKPLADGKLSLYLDFYPPITDQVTGKKTRREFLQLHIWEKPKGSLQRQHNADTLFVAEQDSREKTHSWKATSTLTLRKSTSPTSRDQKRNSSSTTKKASRTNPSQTGTATAEHSTCSRNSVRKTSSSKTSPSNGAKTSGTSSWEQTASSMKERHWHKPPATTTSAASEPSCSKPSTKDKTSTPN